MKISEMVAKSHDNARRKGFWNDAFDVDPRDGHLINPLRFALWHSEVSEAWEIRGSYKGPEDPGLLPEELADIAIRIADFCGWHKIDLVQAAGVADRSISEVAEACKDVVLYEQDMYPRRGQQSLDRALSYLHWMISACLEADRKLTFDEVRSIVGDTFACLLDLCASLGIDIEAAIVEKMEKNRDRPHLHGARY